jgi:hypothetical protein
VTVSIGARLGTYEVVAAILPKAVEDATRFVETLDSGDRVAGTLVYMSPEAPANAASLDDVRRQP